MTSVGPTLGLARVMKLCALSNIYYGRKAGARIEPVPNTDPDMDIRHYIAIAMEFS